MDRVQKEKELEFLKDKLSSAMVTVLADYKGLSVMDLTELRAKLREGGSQMKVCKNTLARLAVSGTPLEALKPHLLGPTAVVFSQVDPVAPAKTLVKFAEEHEHLKIKAGFLDGKLMQVSQVEGLSKLPSREELLSRLLGSLQSPAQKVVNVLSAVPRQLVTVLAALWDTKS